MSLRDDIKAKYGATSATGSKASGSSSAGSSFRQEMLDKYNSKPTITPVSSPTNNPASTITPNLPGNLPVVPSPNNPAPTPEEPSFGQKIAQAIINSDTPGTSVVKNFFQPSNILDALSKTISYPFELLGKGVDAATKAVQSGGEFLGTQIAEAVKPGSTGGKATLPVTQQLADNYKKAKGFVDLTDEIITNPLQQTQWYNNQLLKAYQVDTDPNATAGQKAANVVRELFLGGGKGLGEAGKQVLVGAAFEGVTGTIGKTQQYFYKVEPKAVMYPNGRIASEAVAPEGSSLTEGLTPVKDQAVLFKTQSGKIVQVVPTEQGPIVINEITKRFGAAPDLIPTAKPIDAVTAGGSAERSLATIEGAKPLVPSEIPTGTAGATAAAASTPTIPMRPVDSIISPEQLKTTMDQPISPQVLERIRTLTPEQQVTFGREIENTINDLVKPEPAAEGSQPAENTGMAKGFSFSNQPLSSGAPAVIQPDGTIQVSIPQMAQDIAKLATGSRIAIHTNSPYAAVFKRAEGESIRSLTTRYVSEVILHEVSHQRTMTGADFQEIQRLQGNLDVATASGDPKQITAAQTAIDKFSSQLENKANKFLQQNRESLTQEVLPQLKYVMEKYRTQTAAAKEYKQSFLKTFKKKLQANFAKAKVSEKIETIKQNMRAEKYVKAEKVKSETQTRYENAIAKIKDRQTDIEGMRQEIYEYSKLLPANVRGKFLAAVKNTNTRKEFLEVLDRMKKVSATSQRAQLIREIKKEIKFTKPNNQNGILKGKFTADIQKRLDGIRANLNGSYELARQKRNDLILQWRDENGDAPLPAEILRKLEDLAMVGIKDMDPRELRFTLDAVKSLKENGRTANEIAKFNRESRLDAIKTKILDVITGGRELPSNYKSLPDRSKPTVKENLKNFFTVQQYGFEEILDSLSEFDKGSKPYESFLSRFGRKAHSANGVEFAGQQAEIMRGNEAIKKIYGFTKNREILNFINEMNVAIDLGRMEHSDGVVREVKLTRGEAMYFTALMENPNLAETFSEGMKWTPLIMDAVKKTLREEDYQLVEWLMNDLQKYYPGINEVYRRENFVDLPFDDKYFPLYRQVEKLQKKEASANTTSQLLAEESRYYSTVKNGSLKTRSDNAVPIEPKNILDVWYDHKIKMEHYKAWADTMYDFRRVFGDPEVRQSIIDFHGRPYIKAIDGFLDDMARGGIDGAKINQAIEKFRRNVTRSILGVNWKVSTRQLMGIVNYMVEIPVKDFFGGITDFFTDPLAKANFLTDNSAVMRERFGEGFERDIKFALQRGYADQLSKARNIDEMFFYLIRQADKMTVMPGSWAAYRSKYLELKGKGFSNEEARSQALEFAELVTNRIQETSQLDTLSPIQRGGTLMKLLTMFQSQPSKFFRIAMNSYRNYRAGRGSKANNLKRLFMVWFLLPLLWQFMVDGFKPNKKHLITTAFLGPFSYPLIIGQMIQSFAGWITGDNKYDYEPSAVTSTFSDMKNAGEQLSSGDFVDGTTYLIDLMGKIFGAPTGLVTKPIRAAKKAADKAPKYLP